VSSGEGVGLNKVHVIAQRNSPNRPPVAQGSSVTILASQRSGGVLWYQISYSNNQGWIEAEYLNVSGTCP
jgi:uncharacterized protein YgiM (DUF1202 family)